MELDLPLCVATSNGHTEVVRLLLAARADIQMYTRNTPEKGLLGEACSKGYVEIVRLLLNAGARKNVTFSSYWGPPLALACDNDHPEVVRLLLEARADVEQACGLSPDRHSGDWTPLGTSSHRGGEESVRLLLEARADANRAFGPYEETPLGLAAAGGHAPVARLLLEVGVDVDRDFGFCSSTPLGAACTNGHAKVVSVLLEARANPDRQFGGRASPMLVGRHMGDGRWQMNPYERDRIMSDLDRQVQQQLVGDTPLGAAARAGHAEILHLLLQAGADMEKTFGMYGDRDNTVLGTAIVHGQTECEGLLVQAGADTDRTLAVYATHDAQLTSLDLLRPKKEEEERPLLRSPLLHVVRAVWGSCMCCPQAGK